jgi:hypothetical protein
LWFAICDFSESEWPVVPITIAFLFDDGRRGMKAEINDDIAPGDDSGQVVALVNLSDNLNIVEAFRARNQRMAHPAFRAGNNNASHKF